MYEQQNRPLLPMSGWRCGIQHRTRIQSLTFYVQITFSSMCEHRLEKIGTTFREKGPL